MKNTLLALTLIVGILFTTAAQSPRTSWEYKLEYKMSEKKINELGSQGWELVAIGGTGSGPMSNVTEYVFKRPKN